MQSNGAAITYLVLVPAGHTIGYLAMSGSSQILKSFNLYSFYETVCSTYHSLFDVLLKFKVLFSFNICLKCLGCLPKFNIFDGCFCLQLPQLLIDYLLLQLF